MDIGSQPSDNEEQSEKTQDKVSEAETETSTSIHFFLQKIYIISHRG
jgi:hypothetical protein